MSRLSWVEIECPGCGVVTYRSRSEEADQIDRYVLCPACRRKRELESA